jgi:hypothetical protein
MPSTATVPSTMESVKALAGQQELPLQTVLQQCNDNENLNPVDNFTAWSHCLQGVYDVRTSKPSISELGDAMYQVWSSVLVRSAMTNALLVIKNGSTPAFQPANVYIEVDKYYPITLSIVIDTTATMARNSAIVTVTDDNGDPQQGSNEITVNAKVGNTLIWSARSTNGTDTIQLKQFIRSSGVDLFPNGEPSLQGNGTFQGTLNKVGYEVYHFAFTINNGPTQYQWDPFIRSTN